MEKGITAMVRSLLMAPVNFLAGGSFLGVGPVVGPASSSFSQQMKVRDSHAQRRTA